MDEYMTISNRNRLFSFGDGHFEEIMQSKETYRGAFKLFHKFNCCLRTSFLIYYHYLNNLKAW